MTLFWELQSSILSGSALKKCAEERYTQTVVKFYTI
jgi:hypothetical protein